ncbi:MAG TPA: GNAT family N-acetyltransferase, partial [Burkholderiales bacterium]|nr:GNAT family N-acetyltransferase [Burkholderiales bacterium]
MAALLRPYSFALADGRRLRLRPIRETDAEGVRAAFYRLSDESRYQRFMAPLKDITPDLVRKATHPTPGRDVALVAAWRGPGAEVIAGGARIAGGADRACCEFAVTVVDDWQGRGIGSRLMRKLLRVAQAMGYRTMVGYVLAGNARMLDLARRLGFRVEDSSEGPNV